MSYYGYRDADPYYADDVDRIEEVALRESYQRSRKEHRCDSCSRFFAPGMVYRSEFGLVDGKPYYVKTCYDCLQRERQQ